MNKNINNFCESSNDSRKIPKIRLQRTCTNTTFEIIIGLLLIILWGGIVFKIATSNGTPIPIHTDLSGNADSFASPYWLLLIGGVCTALAVYYMFAAYRPHYLQEAGTRITNMRQIKILVYWAYIFTIEMISIAYLLTFGNLENLTVLFLKVMAIVIIVTCLVTIIAVRRLQ